MSDEQSKFEGYAVVEIMGHNREIGYVTTAYFGGPALFRIDQPPIPARESELTRAEWIGDVLAQPGTKVERVAIPGKTSYVGPQAVFRLTPCDQETALKAIERMIPAPIKILSLVEAKKLGEGAAEATSDDQDSVCPDCEAPVQYCECGNVDVD